MKRCGEYDGGVIQPNGDNRCIFIIPLYNKMPDNYKHPYSVALGSIHSCE